jgi:ectoine hydroxylase-related dioxygenase (phytanoyl-CoA dioxygenase family)
MARIDCHGLATEGLTTQQLASAPQVREAGESFVKDGYVILDRLIDEAKMNALLAEFRRRYMVGEDAVRASEFLEVSARRYMLGVELSGGFADRSIYANPVVLALGHKLLGQDMILEAFGAIVSCPRAEAQVAHADAPELFSPEISPILPPYAMTCALPLVDLNEVSGAPAVWPRSHRARPGEARGEPEWPVVPVGSCVIWDFRLEHRGSENRSQRARPMLYATYTRRWFRDPVNFTKGLRRRLAFDPATIDREDDDLQRLLSHAM